MECFKFIIPLGNRTTSVIYFTGNIVLAVASFAGNGIVMYLVWFNSRLHTPTYVLISALALSDFATSLLGQLTYCVEVAFKTYTSCTYDKIIAFFNASSCTSSLLLLCLIARDRFIHVSKGRHYQSHMNVKYSKRASMACFVLGMAIATLFTFEERYIRIVSTFVFAVIAGSCFAFIAIHSKRILRIVNDHVRRMNESVTNNAIKANGMTTEAMERAVNRSVLSVVALYFFAWTPVIVLMVIFTYHNIRNKPIADVYRTAFIWASHVSYLNGALNPVIYAYRCDAIGCEMRKVFRRIFCRNRLAAEEIVSTDKQAAATTAKASFTKCTKEVQIA